MTTVEIAGTNLVVRLIGLNQLWALKRSITVPLSSVQSAAIAPPDIMPKGIRAPGTYIPGPRHIAGTWRGRGGKEFWNVKDRSRAIVITLTGAPYNRLVVQVDNPGATVAAIEAARTRPAS